MEPETQEGIPNGIEETFIQQRIELVAMAVNTPALVNQKPRLVYQIMHVHLLRYLLKEDLLPLHLEDNRQ
jgi:hypothetical protein